MSHTSPKHDEPLTPLTLQPLSYLCVCFLFERPVFLESESFGEASSLLVNKWKTHRQERKYVEKGEREREARGEDESSHSNCLIAVVQRETSEDWSCPSVDVPPLCMMILITYCQNSVWNVSPTFPDSTRRHN